MERTSGIRKGAIGGMLAALLLVGFSAGEVAARHDKAKVKTRVVNKRQKVAGYRGTHLGNSYSYGRTRTNWNRWPTSDFDRDGIPNHRDRDDDNDGIRDSRDRYDRSHPRARQTGSWRGDLDRDGISDRRDRDVDNDGYRNTNDRYPRDRRRH
ncbi:MAG: hypothetical protein ACO1SX_03010 [Actinomycetota bacterium]